MTVVGPNVFVSFFLVGCADLQSLDTMQPMERKRQGYIHEFIQTEERYMDDLQLVLEVRLTWNKIWFGKITKQTSSARPFFQNI